MIISLVHETNIAFGSTFFHVQNLLQLFAQVYIGDMCLPSKNITGNAYQFLFLAFLFFPLVAFLLYKCASRLLCPKQKASKERPKTTVTDFQGFYHRLLWVLHPFPIERISRCLGRCSSEPKCPRSFNPLGTKCSTQRIQVL